MTNLSAITPQPQKKYFTVPFPPPEAGITSTIMTITPEMASEILSTTNLDIQRKVRRAAVTFLARQMKEGKWDLNGDAIRFDVNRDNIDGGHRLNACVEAQTPFTTVVVFNLPSKVIETIDTQRQTRSLANIMDIMFNNVQYVTAAASLVEFLLNFKSGRYYSAAKTDTSGSSVSKALSISEKIRFFEENSETLPKFIIDNMSLYTNGDKLLKPKVFLGLKYICDGIDPLKSNTFFSKLATGVGVEDGCPSSFIRTRLIAAKTSNDKKLYLSDIEKMGLVIKGFQYFRLGKKQKSFQIPKTIDGLI